MTLLPAFVTEWKAKFSLEVGENKVVIFSLFRVHGLPWFVGFKLRTAALKERNVTFPSVNSYDSGLLFFFFTAM
jgi:hypothetical protein